MKEDWLKALCDAIWKGRAGGLVSGGIECFAEVSLILGALGYLMVCYVRWLNGPGHGPMWVGKGTRL